MKTFRDYLKEITKSTYVNAMRRKTGEDDYDPKAVRNNDVEGQRSSSAIIKRAGKQQGKKFAKQLSDVDGTYGKTRSRDSVKGSSDKLANRAPTRVTKAGKANATDTKTLKNIMKGKSWGTTRS